MMLTHEQIWDALDALAAKQGLSPSALAKRAGLDPTAFNKSKRVGPEGSKRPRWPSTESLAKVLEATGASLEDFASLVDGVNPHKAPNDAADVVLMINTSDALHTSSFDNFGSPAGDQWSSIALSELKPQSCFAIMIENDAHEPVYREGDKLIVAPGEPVKQGNRVVVKTTSGELLIKTLGRRSPTQIELRPLHTTRPMRILKSNDIAWISKIALVSQ